MGRSQSRVIVEVLAPVALPPGIALSPWSTVRYGRHRQKVVISFRSSLPRTSLVWTPPSLPSFGPRPVARVQPNTPHPGLVALASSHHPPRLLQGLVDSLSLACHTFFHQPRGLAYMVPVQLPSSMVAVRRCLRLGIVKGLRGGWALTIPNRKHRRTATILEGNCT